MSNPRMYFLLLLSALVADGSSAMAQESSRDQSFICATLCPGSACPQRCKTTARDEPNKKTDSAATDGPAHGGYEAAQPRERLKTDTEK
jgi:hypothetical protein